MNAIHWNSPVILYLSRISYQSREDNFEIDIFIISSFVPCPVTGPKMFCPGSNFLSQPKNLNAFSASSKTFVPAQKPILLNANHRFVWQKMLVTGTVCKYFFGLAQKIWTSTKHFGTCKRTRHQ